MTELLSLVPLLLPLLVPLLLPPLLPPLPPPFVSLASTVFLVSSIVGVIVSVLSLDATVPAVKV